MVVVVVAAEDEEEEAEIKAEEAINITTARPRCIHRGRGTAEAGLVVFVHA